MATYIIRKVVKRSKVDFYTVEKSYFLELISKRVLQLSTFKEALDTTFKLKDCKNIIIK